MSHFYHYPKEQNPNIQKAFQRLNFTLDGVLIISLWPLAAIFIKLKKRNNPNLQSLLSLWLCAASGNVDHHGLFCNWDPRDENEQLEWKKMMIGFFALFLTLISHETIRQAMALAKLIYLWWFISSLGSFTLALTTLNRWDPPVWTHTGHCGSSVNTSSSFSCLFNTFADLKLILKANYCNVTTRGANANAYSWHSYSSHGW